MRSLTSANGNLQVSGLGVAVVNMRNLTSANGNPHTNRCEGFHHYC